MVVKNEKFTAIIDEFTQSTYIMVIVADPKNLKPRPLLKSINFKE